jgi:hypothetical protein
MFQTFTVALRPTLTHANTFPLPPTEVEMATVASVAATPISSDYTLADDFDRVARSGGPGAVFGGVGPMGDSALKAGLGHRRVIRVTNGDDDDDDEPDNDTDNDRDNGSGGHTSAIAGGRARSGVSSRVPRTMVMSEGVLRSILDSQDAFKRHVNLTSLCNTDEVSPWELVNDITEEILNSCVKDVCQELGTALDDAVQRMVAAETA